MATDPTQRNLTGWVREIAANTGLPTDEERVAQLAGVGWAMLLAAEALATLDLGNVEPAVTFRHRPQP